MRGVTTMNKKQFLLFARYFDAKKLSNIEKINEILTFWFANVDGGLC